MQYFNSFSVCVKKSRPIYAINSTALNLDLKGAHITGQGLDKWWPLYF